MNRKEALRCFAALEIRERLIVKLAVLAGLRPGEIFGLQWGHFIDSPKSSHSVRKAALSAGILDEIRAWKSMSLNTNDDAWVFPSETGKTPLWRDNLWRR